MFVMIDPQLIDSFNEALYRLSRPAAVRHPNDVTTHYADVIEHPTDPDNNWPLLVLPDDDDMPIHPQARQEELDTHLNIFVANGGMTAGERNSIRAAIVSARGGRTRIADMIPPSWFQFTLSRPEAEELGYFGEVFVEE